MKQKWSNILLIAGSGQNSGKTTFICRLLESLSDYRPITVKISRHFYEPTPGLKALVDEENYQLFEETNLETRKDSSRYLQHGATRSFYIQARDQQLQLAFMALLPYLEAEQPILIESAAMHHIIDAGLFILIIREDGEQKPSTEINKKVADLLIYSDGQQYSPTPDHLIFDSEWKIKS
ncbi:P-loop NTPase family protein [Mangrovibacterium lignilyticum]|uniref:molybdopterin-guanine dinucleotide biosynthesis protein B n=1 Tax=Mangrovibacterium lignilyticum TaxID=2668052 RepID=UPI0013D2D3C3|nr:molybdopterin-guanine dinucleotide biosynthesis protein B [Mangrovibacterium lignilyticum]